MLSREPRADKKNHQMAPRSDLLWSLPLLLLLPQRTASFASNGVFARSNAPSQAAAPVALRPAELMVRHPRAKMIFDQFDRDAMRLIMDAQAETRKLGGESVGTEHVLLASCMQSDELQASLERAGLKADELRVAINPNSRKMPGLDSLFAASSKDELLPFAKVRRLGPASIRFRPNLLGLAPPHPISPRPIPPRPTPLLLCRTRSARSRQASPPRTAMLSWDRGIWSSPCSRTRMLMRARVGCCGKWISIGTLW